MIENQHAVVDCGDVGRRLEQPIGTKSWTSPKNVVAVPFARRSHDVDHRGRLFVDRARLAVEVGFVVIRIEYLNFVDAHQKQAAVATALALAVGRCGSRPFDVDLAVAEFWFADNITFARKG